MKAFISPEEANKPIITANGVLITPHDIKVGKTHKSNRIAPFIGNRWKHLK